MFAKYAFYAQDYEEAVRQFDLIGNYFVKTIWGGRRYFYECRAKAYEAVGRTPAR
ncbi:MAG: hypothetical protein Kow0099_15760 [Candidatus Abyssubacteria bacterium]